MNEDKLALGINRIAGLSGACSEGALVLRFLRVPPVLPGTSSSQSEEMKAK